VVTIAFDPHYARHLSTIPWLGHAELSDWSNNIRYIQYLTGITVFLQHPVLGIGLGGALAWSIDKAHLFLTQHSITLQLASETGLIGFTIYALAVATAMRRSAAALRATHADGDKWGRSLTAASLASLVAMLFWAQLQPMLMHLEIYLCCALCSVSASVFVGRCRRTDPALSETSAAQAQSPEPHCSSR